MNGEPLDLAELAASLVREVRDGVAAADEELTTDLRVVAGRVRVGQRTIDTADLDTTGRDVEAEPGTDSEFGAPSTTPIVLRSGLEDAGWEVEFELGRGRTGTAEVSQIPGEGRATLPELWAERPLTALKGIDTRWQRRLHAHGLATLGDLLALDEDRLAALVAAMGSHRPLEFHTKATLLRTTPPRLGPSPADDVRLDRLTGVAPERLREIIGTGVCSAAQARVLFGVLAVWSAAVDRRVLGTLTLAEMRDTAS